MRKIEKKTTPEFFEDILNRKKNFEVRLADWKCKVGDVLILREWDPKARKYTGRSLEKKVSYVLETKGVGFWKKKDIEKYGFQIIAFK